MPFHFDKCCHNSLTGGDLQFEGRSPAPCWNLRQQQRTQKAPSDTTFDFPLDKLRPREARRLPKITAAGESGRGGFRAHREMPEGWAGGCLIVVMERVCPYFKKATGQ